MEELAPHGSGRERYGDIVSEQLVRITRDEARAQILALIRDGWLIGVEVFGADDCCEHGMHTECPADGFGLCDMFGPHSIGSDCNSAEPVLMRPDRTLYYEDDAIREALTTERTLPVDASAVEVAGAIGRDATLP